MAQEELENPEQWDYEGAEAVQPHRRQGRRVIVSVAFSRPDFELVATQAEKTRRKLSEYIRSAAMERATVDTAFAQLGYSYGTPSGAFYWSGGVPSLSGTATRVDYPLRETATPTTS